MNAANQRRLTPVLAAIVVVLGVVLLLLLGGIGRKVRWSASRPPVSLSSFGTVANLPTPLPLEQFALVWQKPLFNPDRKPIARVANGGTSLGDIELTGIILTPGLRMALLHDKNGDRQIRLREGESLPDGGVTLVEVHPRSAMFDSSAGRTELKLPAGAPFDNQKAGAAAPADPGNQGAAGAVISIGPHGAGRQNGQSGRGRGSQGAPPQNPDNSPASFIERLKANNQRRRAERAAATH